MARSWTEPEEIDIPAEVAGAAGHPLLARALASRGLRTRAEVAGFLDADLYTPAAPEELPGMVEAASRIETAIQRGEQMCVWGDFDVDGQTATTALVECLRELGAQVQYYLPVRASESHGVHAPKLQEFIQNGTRLVLTCDTGISAQAAAELARDHGVDFIITDHHELPASLPPAQAIVTPRMLPEGHPLGALPGVGVAYKLAEALYQRAGLPEGSAKLLDLVALGIVADVAQLSGDTRYLLQRGLRVLRQTRREGLLAMLEFAGLQAGALSEEQVGFILAPRLNALGRLGDANPVVEFLLSADLAKVRVMAQQLEALNAERKLITSQIFQAVLGFIEQDRSILDEPALVFASPAWPAGVIGIVASRLVEHFGKPAALISCPAGQAGRGSARSVEGINITAVIGEVQAADPDLVRGFGGHPFAAGFSLAPERAGEFRHALGKAIQALYPERPPEKPLVIDGYLQLSELTLELTEAIEQLAPFGPGNPPLVLASRNLTLKSQATIGRDSEHLAMVVEDQNGTVSRVVWWQGAGWPQPEGVFDLAYILRSSAYRGEREVSIQWVDFRPVPAEVVTLTREEIEIDDFRGQPQPLIHLQQLAGQGNLQVWAEGQARTLLAEKGVSQVRYRHELVPRESLAIWTTPPGDEELQAALAQVKPKKVHLFCIDPEPMSADDFLERLAGLAKYALAHYGGRARLSVLGAVTAQRVTCVREGIVWLVAQGHVSLVERSDDEIVIAPGLGVAGGEGRAIFGRVSQLLAETNAYRTLFRQSKQPRLG